MLITYKLKGSDDVMTVYIDSGSRSDVEITINDEQALVILGADVESVTLDSFGVDLLIK